MGMTPMIAPDGSSGEIPSAKVADAVKAGGKIGAWMLDPQGNRGIIPLDKTTEAIQAGARPIASLPAVNMKEQGQFGIEYNSPTSAQQKAKGEYESANLKPIGEALGAMATGGLLKTPAGASAAEKLLKLAGRAALSGAGVGAGAAAGGASPAEVGSAAATGAVMQPVAEGISAAASNLAPKIAESALNITDRMRGRGRTIGDAVLEETTGVKPSTLAADTRQAIGNLVGQMERAVDTATQSGVTGSTQGAHDILNNSLSDLPRNAKTIRAKLEGLHDLLDLDNNPRTDYTPTELLEMKRGIGQEMKTWPLEWQKMDAVKQVQQRLYGAIDKELDHLVPGNAELNQTISSLIPAKQQAAKLAEGASIAQLMAHRLAAHTGALAASGVGGAVGYREGGPTGAAIGAAAGLALPEIASSPTGQMVLARMLNALGPKATSPEMLPLVKALAAHAVNPQQPETPSLPFHPGSGL